jgi:hypothetical protein
VRATSQAREFGLLAKPHPRTHSSADETLSTFDGRAVLTPRTLLYLQRHAGNAAVASLLVQRCGSTPCDCSPEDKQARSNSTKASAETSTEDMVPIVARQVAVQLRPAPYIKKVTVHLAPPQEAELEWQGTPPADAVGKDTFTVSTGKGYGNPDDDPPGTCTRKCCKNPDTQCAPPWNQPEKVGSCCTYFGSAFWTGKPQADHGGIHWWTPIQPFYSSRAIALHQYSPVTGQPIGHGCVRMDEDNAKRIFDFSNGRKTNVTIDGRAAPVDCPPERRCGATVKAAGSGTDENR